eukprot:m.52617 g.52617  ORF g.52617 m.52617 type:complete len:476 (-) comp15424_c0_seq1:90-1517(-)
MATNLEHGNISNNGISPARRRVKRKREFDISKYHERHIAFRMAYLGMRYHGFSSQGPEDEDSTVEGVFFKALTKACLISDRLSCNYSRCGRTDKGVSAFGQVVALCVRSNLSAVDGQDVKGFKINSTVSETQASKRGNGDSKKKQELDYVHIINRLLPDDVRIITWTPVEESFSARFSCSHRTYRYFFLKEDLNIGRMQEAAQKYLGEHDYRNFCKMDIVGGVTNFKRNILSVDIKHCDGSESSDNRFTMFYLEVKGMAFLWHQIRCMIEVLFQIGRGEEESSIIDKMLDIESMPAKPQYRMASELPLVLYNCEFKDIQWAYNGETLRRICTLLHETWKEHAIKAAIVSSMLRSLDDVDMAVRGDVNANSPSGGASAVSGQTDTGSGSVETAHRRWADCAPPHYNHRPHIPMLEREKACTLEHRLASHAKRLEMRARKDSANVGTAAASVAMSEPHTEEKNNVSPINNKQSVTFS